MLDWIKRLFNTDTSAMREDLAETNKHNRQLQKLLVDQLRASAEREAKLISCLDRVVMSRFDAPLMPKPADQPDNGYLPFGEHLSDVLSIDGDREFLEKTSAA